MHTVHTAGAVCTVCIFVKPVAELPEASRKCTPCTPPNSVCIFVLRVVHTAQFGVHFYL